MNEKEFYDLVKNRDARTFFNNLELDLNKVSACSGANIHNRDSLKQVCRSSVGFIENNYDSEVTFLEYRNSYPDFYEGAARRIVEAVNRFGVRI